MFWLIENEEQLNKFINKKYDDVFIEIIPFYNKEHPINNPISLIYIRPINYYKGYMLALNHQETFSVDIDKLDDLIQSFDKIYTYNKKDFLFYFFNKNIIDISLINDSFRSFKTSIHKSLENKSEYSNYIIPITKHYESCEVNFKELKPYFNKPYNKFFNDKAILVFNHIERNTIKLDTNKSKQFFPHIDKDCLYSHYNLKTTTTRPSNTFDSINLLSLDKKSGERICIIPNNDLLFEIDISAYHPYLLSKLIGYDFGNSDIHAEFAEIYGVDYDKAKIITFKQLYGGIWDDYKDIPFFRKTITYTNKIYEQYISEGFIEAPISKYRFEKDKLGDLSPTKLLNYILQSIETSNNVNILWDIIKIIRKKKTKLILYVFDSFLLDVDKDEKDVLFEILEIFKKRNLNIKTKWGLNYEELKKMEL
jgi:hypothetical protein